MTMKIPSITEAQLLTVGKLSGLGMPTGELSLSGLKTFLKALLLIGIGVAILGYIVAARLRTGVPKSGVQWTGAIAGTLIAGLIVWGGVEEVLRSFRDRRRLYLFEHGLIAVAPDRILTIFPWRTTHVHNKVSQVVSHPYDRNGSDFRHEYTLTRSDGETLKLDSDMGEKKAVMALGRRIAAAANFEQGR
ncbi:MAG TPA: hypothetical protein VGR26_03730 [Acidimicrobiales bacterium]|nr:hypothetical protein [Acidimicrobiales bacterium]